MFTDLGIASAMKHTEVKRSRLELTLLAVINGIFITIRDYELKKELAPTIEYGLVVCKECIDVFPEDGNSQLNFFWAKGKLQEAEKFLGEGANNLYSAVVLSKIADNVISDLMSLIVTSDFKRNLLVPIEEVITGLCAQLDPEGEAFDAYEQADVHLRKLYDVLGVRL